MAVVIVAGLAAVVVARVPWVRQQFWLALMGLRVTVARVSPLVSLEQQRIMAAAVAAA